MQNQKENVLKKELAEFRKFIARGNVVDMAIGVIIGNAFGKIVTSLVNDILMPLIGTILGGLNFSSLSINFRNATIVYGAFIQSVVDFLIIAVCIFVMIRVLEKLKFSEKEKEEEVVKVERSEEVLLLEEIRDLLKKNNSKNSKK